MRGGTRTLIVVGVGWSMPGVNLVAAGVTEFTSVDWNQTASMKAAAASVIVTYCPPSSDIWAGEMSTMTGAAPAMPHAMQPI